MLRPQRILCRQRVGSKKSALELLANLLAESDDSLSPVDIFDNLLQRERLGSTALGGGAALPHACLQQLEEPVAAFIQLRTGIDYDAEDAQPVDLIFALLLPPQRNTAAPRCKRMAALLQQPQLLRRLRRARSPRDVHTCFLEHWQQDMPQAAPSAESMDGPATT